MARASPASILHLERASPELLQYYRKRIENFAADREDTLKRVADIESQNADVHKLRWDLASRDAEIRELQDALTKAKLYLFDEREQVMKLSIENDNLKAQEIENRQRIAHLLALTEPIVQEVSVK